VTTDDDTNNCFDFGYFFLCGKLEVANLLILYPFKVYTYKGIDSRDTDLSETACYVSFKPSQAKLTHHYCAK